MRWLAVCTLIVGCGGTPDTEPMPKRTEPMGETCVGGFPFEADRCPREIPSGTCTAHTGICGYTEDGCGFVFAQCQAGVWVVTKMCGEDGTAPEGS